MIINTINIAIYIIFGLISYYTLNMILQTFFSTKISIYIFGIISLVGTIISATVYYIAPEYNLIISIVLSLIFSFCYSRNIIKNILVIFLYNVMAAAMEAIICYFIAFLCQTSVDNILDGTDYFIYCHVLLNFIYLLIALFLQRFLTEKNKDISQGYHAWLVCILTACASLYTFSCIIRLSRTNISSGHLTVITVFIILSIINCFIFYQVNELSDYYFVKKEYDDINQYIKLLDNQLNMYKNYNNEVQTISHNLKHDYNLLHIMLEEENYDGIKDFISKHMDNVKKIKIYISSNDSFVDALVNFKLSYADNMNIHAKTNIIVEKSIPIDRDKLSIIIGNLFDNAIEHLSSHQLYDGKISVTLKYIGNVFIFEIRNPVAEKVLISQDMSVKTSKDDKFHHGFGLRSIISTVNSLNGLFKIECTDQEFIANIYIITEEGSDLC